MLSSKTRTRKLKLPRSQVLNKFPSVLKPLSLLTRANLVGRPLTNICLTNTPLTPTTRREFTGPRGEPRGKSIKRSVVVSVPTIKDPVRPLYSARLLRQDPRLLIWLLVRNLDQLVVWDLVLR